MSPENKRRVIGVVVLVAFVALLIPFFFTNGVKKNQLDSDTINIPSESPVISNQLNQTADPHNEGQQPTVTNDATKDLQQQDLPVASPAAVEPLAKNDGLQSESSQASSVEAEPMKPGVVVQAGTLPPPDGDISVQEADSGGEAPTVEASKVLPQSTKATDKVKKAPLATKSSSKDHGKYIGKSDKGSWAVQVGSFSDQARTSKLVKSLQAQGFNVYQQEINTSKGFMVRVLVGREATKEKARKLANQLKARAKTDGYLVRNKR